MKNFFLVLTAALAGLNSIYAQTQGLPKGYRFLGKEGEIVRIKKKCNVAYGADGKFIIIYGIKGSLEIMNSFFGDPAPNVVKQAYYKIVENPRNEDEIQGPDGYIYLGKEGETVPVKGKADAAYGLKGKFLYKSGVTGSVSMKVQFFGGDPLPNVYKYGFYTNPELTSRLKMKFDKARDMTEPPVYDPGTVSRSKNKALPKSYNFTEYNFPETADEGTQSGINNSTGRIENIFFAQTHVMNASWPFFFLIADRPALIEVIVTGKGDSPDVSVTGFRGGKSLGKLYLKGPKDLPSAVSAKEHIFEDRFTVTLPSSWMQSGLSLEINAGSSVKKITEQELRLGPSPEINLIMVPIDVLDFNQDKSDIPVPDTFLGNFAGAFPAAKIRLGYLPARIKLPRLAVNADGNPVPVVLTTGKDKKKVPDGNINAAAMRFINALKYATGDYAYSFYYGNTENYFPGGWGGDKAFVGADFQGVFLHEMGHALSLPHWGEAYNKPNSGEFNYKYPYGGQTNDGGGRGNSWNYYQNIHEFVSPLNLEPDSKWYGKERSDGMQRTHWAVETRLSDTAPWDGFGDFSSFAMFRYMTGAENPLKGTVPYNGKNAAFYLPAQPGFPILTLDEEGNRIFKRQYPPYKTRHWETYDFLTPQTWDTPVYTVYGTYHPQHTHVNILYEPIKYKGNLPKLIDPTNPSDFEKLASRNGKYGDYFWGEKDLTFKFIYADGTVRHALYAIDGVSRKWKPENHPWRRDMLYFAINIPADKKLKRVEVYKRPFCVRNPNMADEGNIMNPKQGITAGNFMNSAVLIMSLNTD